MTEISAETADRTGDAADDTAWQEPHSLSSAAIFHLKVAIYRLRRALLDAFAGLRRLKQGPIPVTARLVARSVTPLWSAERSRAHSHQRGKVQNLTVAAAALDGGLLPAGETFSFWRQIGRASVDKGYADGRMLQSGRLVPAVGGGLCQMSNALYDAALQAECEILERHGHSRIVPGSAVGHGRDATVAWNYVDLRFRHGASLYVSARVTEDELIVELRSAP